MNNAEAPGINVEPKTDGKAIGSLVCGILSVSIFSILAGIPAIILGHISRSAIRKSAGQLKGGGLALTGLIMGYISLAIIPLIVIIATIAIPSLLHARWAAHEAAAVATLRTINAAEEMYLANTRGKFGQITDLIDTDLLDSDIDSGPVSGYYFSVTINSTGNAFTATADPATTNEGRYGYFMTSGGEIRYSTDPNLAPAGAAGQPIP